MASMELEVKLTGLDAAASQLKALGNKVGGSAAGSSGGKGGGGMEAIVSLGTKAVAALAIVAIVTGAIKDILQPILDMISVFIQILVLPFAIVLQGLLRPVLGILIRYLMPLIRGLSGTKPIPKVTGPDGSTAIIDFMGVANALSDLTKALNKLDLAGAIKALMELPAQLLAGIVPALFNILLGLIDALAKFVGILIPGFYGVFRAGLDTFVMLLQMGMDAIGVFWGNLITNVVAFFVNIKGAIDFIFLALKLFLEGDVLGALSAFGMAINELITALFFGLMAIVQGALMMLGPIGVLIWELVGGLLMTIFSTLKGLAGFIWSSAMDILKFVADQLKGALNLAGVVYSMFISVADAVVSALMSKLGMGGEGEGAKSVSDMIITPNGNFSTAPDDYIIATKNPQSLGGGGGTTNITINSPKFESDSDMRKMIDLIKREMSFDLKRGGNYAANI